MKKEKSEKEWEKATTTTTTTPSVCVPYMMRLYEMYRALVTHGADVQLQETRYQNQ
jgi:hypothetical protein